MMPMSFHGSTLEKVKQSSNFEWVGSLKRLVNFNRMPPPLNTDCLHLQVDLCVSTANQDSKPTNLNYITGFHPDWDVAYHTSGESQIQDISSWSRYQSHAVQQHRWCHCGHPAAPALCPGALQVWFSREVSIHGSSPPQDTGLHPAFLQLTLKWLWGFFKVYHCCQKRQILHC